MAMKRAFWILLLGGIFVSGLWLVFERNVFRPPNNFKPLPILGDGPTYSHFLRNTDGMEHLLVIHSHSPLSTKSRWTYTYNLFTPDGKKEDTGSFEASSIYYHPDVIFEPEKSRAVIEINFKPLVITDTSGKETTIQSGYHLGDTLHCILQIKGGKLVSSIETNIYPAPSSLDESFGVSPLQHLGD